ncbi:Nucleoside diphosphate-linked moiety X motif 17 [Oryzias melastigma]|uniref:m7GpppN-mRNA hydrolase NUDT17 n=1 Tax=Oryzias melastigma TaxID=30732 RepID=A0A834C720_ORYME|nr:Nucleoside diphosphate-linked moiety X motif 17 [Oryzias melastigma]
MDKARRILVYVWRERAAPQQAHFLQSLTGFFSDGDDEEVQVSCSLQRNQFILSSGDEGRRVPLKRASFCPIKHLSPAEAAAIPPEVRQRGVDVGVSIMLQAADQRVLLTRRAKELRIFPNVWVPPGGHVEPEETMLEAGLRELQEETGLRLDPEEVSSRVLGLWESVFPPLLSRGLPHRHHVVVYMLLLSPLSHLQLQVSPALSAFIFTAAPVSKPLPPNTVVSEPLPCRGQRLRVGGQPARPRHRSCRGRRRWRGSCAAAAQQLQCDGGVCRRSSEPVSAAAGRPHRPSPVQRSGHGAGQHRNQIRSGSVAEGPGHQQAPPAVNGPPRRSSEQQQTSAETVFRWIFC